MASSMGDRASGRGGRFEAGFVIAVAVPLVIAALAYALWWISDRLVTIGPFDRATFGWGVVIPIWICGPIAAGFAWQRLSEPSSRLAAAVVTLAVGGAAAVLFWRSVAYPDCASGPVHQPIDWVLPSLLVGLVIGGGLAGSALVVRWRARGGRRWQAVILGAGAEAVMVLAAILVAAATLVGPGCQRPSI